MIRDWFQKRAGALKSVRPDPGAALNLEHTAHAASAEEHYTQAAALYWQAAVMWRDLAAKAEAYRKPFALGRAEHCWRLAAGALDREADTIGRMPERDWQHRQQRN